MFNWLNQYINNIKQKPEHIRVRYAWGLTIFCSSLIFLLWISTVKDNFSVSKDDLQTNTATNPADQGNLLDSINEDMSTLKTDLFDTIQEGSSDSFIDQDNSQNPYDEEAKKTDDTNEDQVNGEDKNDGTTDPQANNQDNQQTEQGTDSDDTDRDNLNDLYSN